jgi:hypothetical protein
LAGAPGRRTWGDTKETGHNQGSLMRKFALLWTILVVLSFQVGSLTHAQAEVVGRLTLVEGQVDILRGGQLPATPVKVDDGVQPGDVLRTKSLSKAQITFIDNSTLSIAPESRVGIEAYMFDSAQNKRNAVLQLFQGLAHAVVNKVLTSAEPDFVIKTHTAIMGIRGTEFGIRVHPNSSTILNFMGLIQVGNVFPEVGQLSRRAFKLAYSFGSGAGSGGHWVFLRDMQGTTVGRGLPPTQPFAVTRQDMQNFMGQMAGGLTSRKSGGGSGGGSVAGGGTPGASGAETPAVTIRGSADPPGPQTPVTSGDTQVPATVIPQGPLNVIQGNSPTSFIYTPPPAAPPPAVVTPPPPPPVVTPKPPVVTQTPPGPIRR